MGRIQGFPAVFLVFQSGLFAQALHLSSASSSVAPGDRLTIEVSLNSPDGAEVSALQWDITAPSAQLRFLPQETTTGSAVHAAGKSVNCALKASGAASDSTSLCMLYGGRDPIPNGVVARLVFEAGSDAAPGPVRIRASQGLAVSKELKRTPLKDAEISVKVQAK